MPRRRGARGRHVRRADHAERRLIHSEDVPLGRVAAVDEAAAAVLYRASEDAASVAGADLVIDGGASA